MDCRLQWIEPGIARCTQCLQPDIRTEEPDLRRVHRMCPDLVSRGLGDTLAKFTSLFGIQPCGGCQERQEKLNRLWPYR